MNIPKEVYKALIKKCKKDINILGTNPTTIRAMKKGNLDGMTTTNLKKIFEANGLEATLIIKTDKATHTINF